MPAFASSSSSSAATGSWSCRRRHAARGARVRSRRTGRRRHHRRRARPGRGRLRARAARDPRARAGSRWRSSPRGETSSGASRPPTRARRSTCRSRSTPYGFGAAVEQMLALGREEKMRVLVIDDDAEFAACVAAVLEPHGIVVRYGARRDPPGRDARRCAARPRAPRRHAARRSAAGTRSASCAPCPSGATCPSCFSPAAPTSRAASPRSTRAPTTTWRSRSSPRSCSRACACGSIAAGFLRETTERDPLTRCMSRGALLDALASRLSEARRHARTLSVALIDVDRFKRVNDAYGHLVGDHVLMALGQAPDRPLPPRGPARSLGRRRVRHRVPERAGRHRGGGPVARARRVPGMPFHSERGEPFFVTFSAGISSFPATAPRSTRSSARPTAASTAPSGRARRGRRRTVAS